MPFEKCAKTAVETKELRCLLSELEKIIAGLDEFMQDDVFYPDKLRLAKRRVEHMLGLDRPASHAQD